MICPRGILAAIRYSRAILLILQRLTVRSFLSKVPGAIVTDANEAFAGAISSPTSPGESKVMTLIVPHDQLGAL